MTEKINNNEIINSNKDEIKQEKILLMIQKSPMKEKKKHLIKSILLKQKLKQHHFPNLIQIKNRKKIIIIQI